MSFCSDSLRRISTSFIRIFVFSFISASACVDDWIWLTYLLRSVLTMSYSFENSRSFARVSASRFERSMMMSSLTLSSSFTAFAPCIAFAAFLASISRSSLSCATILRWSRSSFATSTTSSSKLFTSSTTARTHSAFSASSPSCFRKLLMNTSTSRRTSSAAATCRFPSSFSTTTCRLASSIWRFMNGTRDCVLTSCCSARFRFLSEIE